MVCKPPPDQGPHHVCRATALGRKREISLRRLLKNTRVWIPYVLTGVNAPFNFVQRSITWSVHYMFRVLLFYCK